MMHCNVDRVNSIRHIWQTLNAIGVDRITESTRSGGSALRQDPTPGSGPHGLSQLHLLRRGQPQGPGGWRHAEKGTRATHGENSYLVKDFVPTQ